MTAYDILIQIELHNFPAEFSDPGKPAGGQLKNKIKDYADRLWGGLGFSPINAKVEITSLNTGEQEDNNAEYFLTINNRFSPTGQGERSIARAKTMAPSVLAAEICGNLFYLREAILSPVTTAVLVTEAQQKNPECGWQGVDQGVCQFIFSGWLEIGLNIWRLLEQPVERLTDPDFAPFSGNPDYTTAAIWLENGARAMPMYRLAIAFSSSEHAFPIAELSEQITAVSRDVGTPLPRLTQIISNAVPDGYFEFYINDATYLLSGNLEESREMILSIIRRSLSCFQSLDLTTARYNILVADESRLASYFQSPPTLHEITLILRVLLADRIKLNFAEILNGYLLITQTAPIDTSQFIVFASPLGLMSEHQSAPHVESLTPWQKADVIRVHLSRSLSFQFAPMATISVLLVDPELEWIIREGQTHGWSAEELQNLLQAIRREYSLFQRTAVAILTTMDVRAELARVIRNAFPNLAVLAYQELSPDLSITPLARVTFD